MDRRRFMLGCASAALVGCVPKSWLFRHASFEALSEIGYGHATATQLQPGTYTMSIWKVGFNTPRTVLHVESKVLDGPIVKYKMTLGGSDV